MSVTMKLRELAATAMRMQAPIEISAETLLEIVEGMTAVDESVIALSADVARLRAPPASVPPTPGIPEHLQLNMAKVREAIDKLTQQHEHDRAEIVSLDVRVAAERADKDKWRAAAIAADERCARMQPVYDAAKVVAAKRISCDCEDCANARVKLRQVVADTVAAERSSSTPVSPLAITPDERSALRDLLVALEVLPINEPARRAIEKVLGKENP